MKLKFKVSQITDLDPETINGLILLKLKDEKYRVKAVTKNSVTFDDGGWELRSNFRSVGRLQDGMFETSLPDNSVLVTLNYYLSLTIPVITIVIISIFFIVQNDYYGPLFVLAFFVLAISVGVMISKGTATEMLKEILE